MPSKRTRCDLADGAVRLARALQPRIARALKSPDGDGDDLRRLEQGIQAATGSHSSSQEFADQYAQSLTCGATTMALAGDLFRQQHVRDWVLSHANPLWRNLLGECFELLVTPFHSRYQIDASDVLVRCTPDVSHSAEFTPHRGGSRTIRAERVGDVAHSRQTEAQAQSLYFFEAFLQRYDAKRRGRHGVFYTPQPIARYIVAKVHGLLCDRFHLPDGLADAATWRDVAGRFPDLAVPAGVDLQTPFVRILDPALGTGVFLAEAIRLIHREVVNRILPCDPADASRRWNEYVAGQLLPRLCGLELMLPACIVANLTLVRTLAETGFGFLLPSRVEIHLANTLAGSMPGQRRESQPAPCPAVDGATATDRRADLAPVTVVVGNPPFSGISRDQNRWIIDLLRGRVAGEKRWANYYEFDEQPLGERKTWLQDDYVKFMRFAHWTIESTGCGVVGLVTNHGYLDNPTFRGMRQQLLQTFPFVAALDLHGNRKKGERTPDGHLDGNVFAIEQGTAIGLFCRPPGESTAERLYAELWGPAEEKLDVLQAATDDSTPPAAAAGSISWRTVTPESPLCLLVPRDPGIDAEYASGVSVAEAMPNHVTAPVTARDRFVVAFTREELLRRMEEFRDLSIPDDEIRRRYFTRTRSPRYPAGDTRGWKMADARWRMADDPAWRDHVRSCWYRPFDRRAVYWTPWMIDWPREDLMPSLLVPGNMALIARRQMLPTQPRNFFWITDTLTIDGLIRSDNRGSETVFPLLVATPRSDDAPLGSVNFSDAFIETVERATGLPWSAADASDSQDAIGPIDLLHYIYAVFFSTTYRSRYAECLLSDFPRVFLARRADVFAELVQLGQRLAAAHLLRTEPNDAELQTPDLDWRLAGPPTVDAGFPKYANGRVWLNRHVWLDGVASHVWEFLVGGHQVCRKWLKDRRGRVLTTQERRDYGKIVCAIEETHRCVDAIDAVVQRQGGWTRAFTITPG